MASEEQIDLSPRNLERSLSEEDQIDPTAAAATKPLRPTAAATEPLRPPFLSLSLPYPFPIPPPPMILPRRSRPTPTPRSIVSMRPLSPPSYPCLRATFRAPLSPILRPPAVDLNLINGDEQRPLVLVPLSPIPRRAAVDLNFLNGDEQRLELVIVMVTVFFFVLCLLKSHKN